MILTFLFKKNASFSLKSPKLVITTLIPGSRHRYVYVNTGFDGSNNVYPDLLERPLERTGVGAGQQEV
jgi:hypothetical protein